MSLSPYIVTAACAWLGAIVSATLYEALSRTGLAGIDRLIERHPRRKRKLEYWLPRWEVLRAVCLLAQTTFELLLVVVIMNTLAQHEPYPYGLLILFFLIAIPVLSFSIHALPKSMARGFADRLTMFFLPVLGPVTILLFPLAKPVAWLGNLTHTSVMAGSDGDDRPTSEDEIKSLVNRATVHDLEDDERKIIESVFEFGDTITREVMTPRVNLEAIEDTETVASAAKKIKGSPHSRFPVYHDSMDDARGLLHVKDLLRMLQADKDHMPIVPLIKPVPFVPESMPINDLLQLLRSEQAQGAIVVDEYGGTAGFVTMEDIVEELIGEIQDEYDQEEKGLQHLSDGSVILDAKMPVDEVNEALDIHVPESEDYDSVGGYIFNELGRIPRPGETLDGSDFTLTIQTANARQLQHLRIQKKTAEDTTS